MLPVTGLPPQANQQVSRLCPVLDRTGAQAGSAAVATGVLEGDGFESGGEAEK